MNRRKLFIMILVLAAAAIPISTVLAKGIVSVTISGPGLKTEIEVSDPDTRQVLMDLTGSQVMAQPKVGGTFYRVAIGFGDEKTGEVFATNVYHYYPNPQGGPGYVLFADVEGGFGSTEGRWFRAAWSAEKALQETLAGYGVSLTGSEVDVPAVAAEQPVRKPDAGSVGSRPAIADKQPDKKADTGRSDSAPAAGVSDPATAGSDNRMMMAALGGLAILLAGGALAIRRRQQTQA